MGPAVVVLTFLIPVLEKEKQRDLCEFQASQGYIEKPCFVLFFKA